MTDFDPQGVNTGDYDEWGGGEFKPPAEGWHILQVVKAERTKSAAGNPMIAVRAKVILSDDDESKGRSVFENFVLEPKFYGKLSSFCTAVDPEMQQAAKCGGVYEGDGSGLDVNQQASIDYHILGQPFRARVYHKRETYQGEKRIKAQIGKYDTIRTEDAERLLEEYGEGLVPEIDGESGGPSADDVY